MSQDGDTHDLAGEYSFWSSPNPETAPADLSEEQTEIEDPFTRENRNLINSPSDGLGTPLTKCHSYIDINDINPNDREWDIAGNWPSKYKRLELLNRGIYNGKWANQELKRGEDAWYLCRNITSQMGLSERLRTRLWNIYKDIDMRSFKNYEISHDAATGQRRQYMVIFCLCAHLYNQNRSDRQPRFYPGNEYEDRQRFGVGCRLVSNLIDGELNDCHDLLQQFADKLQFKDENIRSCMEKLRQNCSLL
jgi:hypothetical protein